MLDRAVIPRALTFMRRHAPHPLLYLCRGGIGKADHSLVTKYRRSSDQGDEGSTVAVSLGDEVLD